MSLAYRPVRRASSWLLLGLLAVAPAALPPPALSADEGGKPSPPVTVEAVLVSPATPGPDTLCKLAVRLKNHADRSVSGLGFRVTVNGADLPVYEKQRYLEALAPGETREIALFNFWSSESRRPAAADGGLAVEVALVEARWVDYKVEDDVPTWTLLDEVPGLPSTKKVAKPFKDGPSAG